MKVMIDRLQILNYKSIKELNLNCSRINVFVGEPNVGKSNILEALDLFLLEERIANNILQAHESNISGAIKDYFRINKAEDFFHNGEIDKVISVETLGDGLNTRIELKYGYVPSNKIKSFEIQSLNHTSTFFNNNLELTFPGLKQSYSVYTIPIVPYKYKEGFQIIDQRDELWNLSFPFGGNLPSVIANDAYLKTFLDELASEMGFEFNIDKSTDSISIQLRINKGLVYTLPFKSLSDTYRRVLFYVAAIRNSSVNIITLEEPEAHSFPKYISLMADEIIDKKDKQFFIATHSPYLLNNLIENTAKEELSIFVCGYDVVQHCTTIKQLTMTDLSELLDYGIDLFFNINKYLDGNMEYHN